MYMLHIKTEDMRRFTDHHLITATVKIRKLIYNESSHMRPLFKLAVEAGFGLGRDRVLLFCRNTRALYRSPIPVLVYECTKVRV